MNVKGVFSHNSDLWTTPLDFFKVLDDEFCFDLDPCCLNNCLHLNYYFTPDDNGLIQDWHGLTAFVNPPYSDISSWAEKCLLESRKGSTVVLLIPVRTDTKYFHDFIYPFAELRFIKGRLKFGDSKNSAPFPSMLCIFRPYKTSL